MGNRLLKLFPAFRFRNYQIFFGAQFISLIGTWMQMVSQGYLAFQLTHSALWVGIAAAAGHIPSTIFALVGGTLVDKYPKKDILRITAFLQFILASLLGILVITGHINLSILMILSFAMGTVNALNQPARIALPHELVDREHLHSAIALNMSMFNSARIVGPAIAGWVIYAFGIGWAFLLNGISCLAPLVAYHFMTWAPHVYQKNIGTLKSIKDGIRYTAKHPLIKYLVLYLGIISIFGWSYVTILPVMAERVFEKGAQELGYLFSAAGLGSVLGALMMSATGKKFDQNKLIFAGGLAYASFLFAFSLTSYYPLALVLLFLTGFGITTQNSTIQTIIQHRVDNAFRGRVSSIQSLMLMGMHPIGSLQVGLIAEHFGSQIAIRIGAVIIFIAAILLYLKSPRHSQSTNP